METTTPVLIAGAGPSGLYFALVLLKNGIKVRIIDKDTVFHAGSRGTGIQPRTLELMDFLGVCDDFMDKAKILPPMRSHKPGPPENDDAEAPKTWEFVDRKETKPSSPHAHGRALRQCDHEELIRDHLKKFGCEVELGVELVDFEQDDKGVTARLRHHTEEDGSTKEEIIQASFVVGADGAKGVVRKLLNLAFLGETKDADAMIVADVETKNLSSDWMHLWEQTKDGGSVRALVRPFTAYSPTNTSFNIIMAGNYTHDQLMRFGSDPDAMQSEFHAVSGRTDVIFDSVPWLSHFRPNMRMVNKFGEGRAFVVGDAAHVHSPTGGQGLNSSMQDAYNLAWKLSLVLKNLAPPSLLETYTDERLPVIAVMLNKTTELYVKTMNESVADTPASKLDQNRRGRGGGGGGGGGRGGGGGGWKRGGALFMLGINYRWSNIVLEERDEDYKEKETKQGLKEEMKMKAYGGYESGLCAGDRAPEAPGLVKTTLNGAETSLFKIFTPSKHSVLIFSSSSSQHDTLNDTLGTIAELSAAKDVIQTFIISRTSFPSDAETNGLKVDSILVDRDGHAHDGYLVRDDEFTVVVVRPDGYIGAITKDKAGVRRYFDKIFIH